MERLIDKTVIAMCCTGIAAASSPTAATVIALLIAVMSGALFEYAPTRLRAGIPLAYCAFACLVPQGALFVPVILYDCMGLIYLGTPGRFTPCAAVAALVAGIARLDLPALTVAALVTAATLSTLLSLRTNRMLARRDISHRLHDDLQTKALELQRQNARLQHERACTRPSETLVDRALSTCPSVGHPTCAYIAHTAGASESPNVSHATRLDAGNAPVTISIRAHELSPRPRVFSTLTEREYEIVRLVAEGLDNKEIATATYMSEGTVRNRISSALSKTGLKNRTQLAATWWRER